MPKRIQRKRTNGWRMPENTVSVTRPGRYGNPYKIGDPVPPETKDILEAFECYLRGRLQSEVDFLEPLRGKDLACFCKEGEPCHADILLRFANEPAQVETPA